MDLPSSEIYLMILLLLGVPFSPSSTWKPATHALRPFWDARSVIVLNYIVGLGPGGVKCTSFVSLQHVYSLYLYYGSLMPLLSPSSDRETRHCLVSWLPEGGTPYSVPCRYLVFVSLCFWSQLWALSTSPTDSTPSRFTCTQSVEIQALTPP